MYIYIWGGMRISCNIDIFLPLLNIIDVSIITSITIQIIPACIVGIVFII